MNIQEVLKRALRFFDQIQQATDEDSPGGKKITLVELPGFIAPTLQLLPIFSELKEVAAQFKDMTDEEKQQTKDDFKAGFSIPDKITEQKIERTFDYLIETGDFISDYKELSKLQKDSQPPKGDDD